MARYLIAEKFYKNGKPLKVQPADKFRKMLVKQGIVFTERVFSPASEKTLENECWDRRRQETEWDGIPVGGPFTFREQSKIQELVCTEFTFHLRGALCQNLNSEP